MQQRFLWAAIAVLFLAPLSCGVVGAIIFRLVGGIKGDLFECSDLQVRIQGATPREVRSLLGNPDQIAQPSLSNRINSRSEPPGSDLWVYFNKTRNPETGKPDPKLLIRFELGRVSFVQCEPVIIPPEPPAPPPRFK